MKYHFKIHKEGKGFWAKCIELPGCVTEGDTREELFENMEDALNTYLDEPVDSLHVAPLPRSTIKTSRSIVEVPVDPSIAFAFTLRRQRIKKGLTQKDVAKRLGMKDLYSYQRLERKCNPSLNMIFKIACLYPSFSIDRIIR